MALLFEFLAALIPALARLFSSKLGQWLVGALIFMGVGFVTHKAINYALNDWVAQGWAGIPAELAKWMSFLNIDAAVSLMLSGYLAGWTVRNGSRAVRLAARGASS